MTSADEGLGAMNSGPVREVCPARLELLSKWTQALTAVVKVATELDYVTENTSDFARHRELLEQTSKLHEEAIAAKNAFEEHCKQHGCDHDMSGGAES